MPTNPDRRPLRPGWSENYDPRRDVWFYINSNIVPPRMSIFHPADVPDPQNATSSVERLTQEPSLNHAVNAARKPAGQSFAQQLYASVQPPSETRSSATNGGSGTAPSYVSSSQLLHDRRSTASESQGYSLTAPRLTIPSQSPPSPQEEQGPVNPSLLYNSRLGLGTQISQGNRTSTYIDNPAPTAKYFSTSTVPSHSSPETHSARRSYTFAALPSGAAHAQPSATSRDTSPHQFRPEALYSPPSAVNQPVQNLSPHYLGGGASYPSPPQSSPPAQTERSAYPFPNVAQGSPSPPTSYTSGPATFTSSPGSQTTTDPIPTSQATLSATPTNYAAPSVVSSSPVNSTAPPLLARNQPPPNMDHTSAHPNHLPHHSYTTSPNFSVSTNYAGHPSNPPSFLAPYNASAPQLTSTVAQTTLPANLTTPSTTYASPPVSYTTPATLANPQTSYPSVPPTTFNQPIGYPSPPTSYPASQMALPTQSTAYPQQPVGNANGTAGAAPMTDNKASGKVLLGIARIVGKAAVKSAMNNKGSGDIGDTITDMITGDNSGGGGGGGGADTMNNLTNTFSGMMNTDGGTSGFGGSGWQQPDLASQYSNIMNQMNQYQQPSLQQQGQIGQPGMAPDPMQQMQQMQQQQQQQQHQQQLYQQQLQQQQYYQQQQQMHQPQYQQGVASNNTAVVAPSAAEITAAVGQATKYVKAAARVAKFATTLSK